ncbi:MAG: 23S rRNA (guanosine(2251)-2'-O)-methyltransferase RlmB [Acidimicrobiales bacterium]
MTAPGRGRRRPSGTASGSVRGGRGNPPGGRAGTARAARSRSGAGRGERSDAARTGGGTRTKAGTRTGGARSGSGGGRARAEGAKPRDGGLGGDQVEGRHAVLELLRADRRRVRSLVVAEGMDESSILDDIEMLAARRRVRVERVPRRRLESLARTEAPQGVVALARPVDETPLEDLCRPASGKSPFLLVLDGITDPQNLGALLRSAECAGVTGVVLGRHRSVHLSPTVTKVAAGAIEYLPMAVVAGIPSALRTLVANGVWTVGLAAEARTVLGDLQFGDDPVALVLGSEGSGLTPLTRRRCDVLASIPQFGTLSSLNVSTAGTVACFEVARGRTR